LKVNLNNQNKHQRSHHNKRQISNQNNLQETLNQHTLLTVNSITFLNTQQHNSITQDDCFTKQHTHSLSTLQSSWQERLGSFCLLVLSSTLPLYNAAKLLGELSQVTTSNAITPPRPLHCTCRQTRSECPGTCPMTSLEW